MKITVITARIVRREDRFVEAAFIGVRVAQGNDSYLADVDFDQDNGVTVQSSALDCIECGAAGLATALVLQLGAEKTADDIDIFATAERLAKESVPA